MDVTFSSQRECKFLESIIAAYEAYDVEAFTNAVVEFDSISKLDAWKTSILLRVKNSIKSEDQGLA
jgi:alpha-soluble NSF attachment protein